jgi:hypothetical protein
MSAEPNLFELYRMKQKSARLNLSKSMSSANAPQTADKTKRWATMAKKHRGFGGKLKAQSFD